MARTATNPKKQPEQLQLDLRAAGGLTAAEVAQIGPKRKPDPYKAMLLRMRAARQAEAA